MNVNLGDTFYEYLIKNKYFLSLELDEYYYVKELKEIKYEWFVNTETNTPFFIDDVKKTMKDDNEFKKFINNKSHVLQYLKNNNIIKIEYTGDSNNYFKIRQHENIMNKYHIVISDLYIYRLHSDQINNKFHTEFYIGMCIYILLFINCQKLFFNSS